MQLYNDDCLNILKKMPSKSIDLIITDPPYEMGGGRITQEEDVLEVLHADIITK